MSLLRFSVVCEECHWSSQVFEPFMDLSLPVFEDKVRTWCVATPTLNYIMQTIPITRLS